MKDHPPFEYTPFPCDFYCEKCGVSGNYETVDTHKATCTKRSAKGYVLQVPKGWRPTEENGGQIWWCMDCRAVFATLKERNDHNPNCPHDFSRRTEQLMQEWARVEIQFAPDRDVS